jgi:hypothetical protein
MLRPIRTDLLDLLQSKEAKKINDTISIFSHLISARLKYYLTIFSHSTFSLYHLFSGSVQHNSLNLVPPTNEEGKYWRYASSC